MTSDKKETEKKISVTWTMFERAKILAYNFKGHMQVYGTLKVHHSILNCFLYESQYQLGKVLSSLLLCLNSGP